MGVVHEPPLNTSSCTARLGSSSRGYSPLRPSSASSKAPLSDRTSVTGGASGQDGVVRPAHTALERRHVGGFQRTTRRSVRTTAPNSASAIAEPTTVAAYSRPVRNATSEILI